MAVVIVLRLLEVLLKVEIPLLCKYRVLFNHENADLLGARVQGEHLKFMQEMILSYDFIRRPSV